MKSEQHICSAGFPIWGAKGWTCQMEEQLLWFWTGTISETLFFFLSPFEKSFSAARILPWQNVNVKPTRQRDWGLIACWVINLSIRAGFHQPSTEKNESWQDRGGYRAAEGVVAIFMERQLNSTVLLLSARSNYFTTTRWMLGLKVQTSSLFSGNQLWRKIFWIHGIAWKYI